MKKRNGFTLIEGMVVMIIMVMVMSSVYMMIMFYKDVSGTEQARVRQTQESRFLLSVFSSEMKNAGAVMTLVNTGGFLDVPSYFNGIYPLNNIDFSDGVILASADPNAVSKLTAAVDISSETDLPVNNTVATPAWNVGDRGILIGPDGYFVFSVATQPAVGDTTLSIRPQPVYFSGLLNTTHYVDAAPTAGAGNTLTYPVNSPVLRLGEFSIYLVQARADGKRELLRVSDCYGIGNVLTSTSANIEKGVIAENIWDMQLVYTAYANFPNVSTREDFFSYGGSSNLDDLLVALRLKTLKEVTVSIVALTDDYPGKGLSHTPCLNLPIAAQTHRSPQASSITGPFPFLIQPRNFNIKI